MSGARVLLVHEMESVLREIARVLADAGFQVVEAQAIAAACEAARDQSIDVVVASSAIVLPADGMGLVDALAIDLGATPKCVVIGEEEPSALVPRIQEALRARDDSRAPSLAPSVAPSIASKATATIPPVSLAKIPLLDMLAEIASQKKSGTLAITTRRGAGELRVVDGDIVDAVYVRLEGTKALARLVAEHEGAAVFMPGTPDVVRRISIPSAELLESTRKAAARATELRRVIGDLADSTMVATDGSPASELSPSTRAVLTRLRVPATLDELLDDTHAPDADVLASLIELEKAGRVRRIGAPGERVQIAPVDELPQLRAIAAHARADGFLGPARVIFAATPGRLAVFAHALLALRETVASPDPAPTAPLPYSIAMLRLGDDVDVEIVALPLVPAYAPLWPMTLAGAAVVVRLDEAAAAVLGESCSAAEVPVAEAHALAGAAQDPSPIQAATLLRAALQIVAGA